MTAETLQRYIKELGTYERGRLQEGLTLDGLTEPVRRGDEGVSVAALDDLLNTFYEDVADSAKKPESTDAWLAPRLHYALRLTRREAGDRGLWHWVALRHSQYVEYRWTGAVGIAADRWFGPTHKQAFARLWWGAELFRDGNDYRPVSAAFQRQDIPNSYIQRTFTRCRPLALGVVAQLATLNATAPPKAKHINDLARVVNLSTAGVPPEAATGWFNDDAASYLAWLTADVNDVDWVADPVGPDTGCASEQVKKSGLALASRAWEVAPSVAKAIGAKGSKP